MSTADRAAAINKYSAMLDAAADADAVMQELGTPTKLAISLARSYVPGAMQEETVQESAQEPAPDSAAESAEEGSQTSDPAESAAPAEESGPVFGAGAELDEEQSQAIESAPEPVQLPEPEPEPEPAPQEAAPEESAPEGPRRRLRAGGAVLAVYTIFAIIIGLPVAVVLIAVGLPFLLLGGGIIAAAVFSAVSVVPLLGMFSDILLVSGAGLVFCAVGLVLAWLGAWISISLGSAWIGGAVLRLGRRLCWKEAGL